MKKCLVWIIVLTLLFNLCVILTREGESTSGQFDEFEVITINGDEEFNELASSENWSGDGSISNPWVIEGYQIDAKGKRYGIKISNTTNHFVIKNCYLHNTSGGYNEEDFGIYMFNVENGLVTNNTLSNTD
ncbi:MAG: hypothetical protein V5A88_07795, partial [Candidatus Thermoplasmatota archaeon]